MPDRLASKSCTSPDSITSSASGSFRAQAIPTLSWPWTKARRVTLPGRDTTAVVNYTPSSLAQRTRVPSLTYWLHLSSSSGAPGALRTCQSSEPGTSMLSNPPRGSAPYTQPQSGLTQHESPPPPSPESSSLPGIRTFPSGLASGQSDHFRSPVLPVLRPPNKSQVSAERSLRPLKTP